MVATTAAILAMASIWLARRGKPPTHDSLPSVVTETAPTAMGDLAKALAGDDGTSGPRVISFNEITFEFGTAALTPAGSEAVRRLATTLKAHPSAVIRLVGHTDGLGNAAANLALSRARADSVRSILLSEGVLPNHVVATGVGDERPIASNASAVGRARNRRIEVVVLSTTGDVSQAH